MKSGDLKKRNIFPNMRKLIRSKTKRAFLTQEGSWTHDPQQAREVDFTEVQGIARQLGLRDAELCYHFDGPHSLENDFGIPLHYEWR